jgi:hypothetical protein
MTKAANEELSTNNVHTASGTKIQNQKDSPLPINLRVG